MVIINFIRDKEVGIFARAKRLSKKATSVSHHKAAREDDQEDSDKSE